MLALALLASGTAVGQSPPPSTLSTVAGTGTEAHTGDGGPATAADIGHPRGIAVLPGGGFVFTEPFLSTVRRVGPDGTITTIAGTGVAGYSGDGGPATAAEVDLPHGVAVTRAGVLFSDAFNHRIRLISPDGTITTVAGTGVKGFSGDGGPAVDAEIDDARGIAALPDGGFLFPDTDNQRIRRVSPDGTITTVAGNGILGDSGDGGPALDAELNRPFSVSPTADGGFLIADTSNNRIRRVQADGTITTVAGTGARGFGGDGGPAVDATLDTPFAVAALPDGGFLIADTNDNRIRRVWPDGTITTIAGTGTAGFSGATGPPEQAEFDLPKALAVLPTYQGFLIGDAANNRVRLVSTDLRRELALRLITRSARIRAGHTASLLFEVPDRVNLRLEVRRQGAVVLRIAGQSTPGRNTLHFGRGLTPGRYALVLRAWSVIDRLTIASGTLTVAAR